MKTLISLVMMVFLCINLFAQNTDELKNEVQNLKKLNATLNNKVSVLNRVLTDTLTYLDNKINKLAETSKSTESKVVVQQDSITKASSALSFLNVETKNISKSLSKGTLLLMVAILIVAVCCVSIYVSLKNKLTASNKNIAKILAETSETINNKIVKTTALHENQINETKDSFDKKLKVISDLFTKSMNETNEKFSREINKTAQSSESQLAELKQNSGSQIKEVYLILDKQIDAVKEMLNQQLKETNESFNKLISQTDQSTEKQIKELKGLIAH